MLYNANLDKASHLRQSKDVLRNEVQKWENLSKVEKPQTVEDVVTYQVCQVQLENDHILTWFQKQNQSEFKRLVALARESKQKLKQENS